MPQPSTPTLTLDDILQTILDIRTQFNLPKPHFGLEQIERIEAPRKALREILEATKRKYGPEICSKRNSLLDDLGSALYAEEIKDRAFSGYWRLASSNVDRALRRVFEIALQTLSQLPASDPKVRVNDRLVALASQSSKLSTKFDLAVRTDKRVRAYLGRTRSDERLRLLGLSPELRWAADMLSAISSGTRTVRVYIDSPNPQVRFALYLAGWIEASAGRKHFAQLKTLAAAAFAADDGRRETPKWVDRLEVEMNRKIKRRRRLDRVI